MTTSEESAPPERPLERPPAELDRRFYAYVVDRALGWGAGAAAGAAAWFLLDVRDPWPVAGVVAGVVVAVSLVLAVLQGTSGATPGRSAMGIRVVSDVDGRPPGIACSVRRGLLLGLAGIPTAFLGVATLAWTAAMDADGRRRGWHDHRTGVVVVDARRPPVTVEEQPAAPQAMVNLTALRLGSAPPPAPAPPPPAPAPPPVPAPPAAPAAPPVPISRPAAATSVADAQATRPPGRPTGAPAARWRVTFDTGESLVVEGLTILGRGPQPRAGESVRQVVPLRSADMSLSKTHAQVHLAGDGVLVVMDRGSTNGSVLLRGGVSRHLPAGRPTTLLEGDRVRFGDREMRVSRDR